MRVLRGIMACAIRFSGIPLLIRNTVARRRVTIVLYHDPRPAVFERHLRYLARIYSLITLDALVDALERQDVSALPRKSLVVTFDDGHRGNHALLPLLRRYGCRPTIYLVSGIVGTARHFWFRDARQQFHRLKVLPNQQRLDALRAELGFTPQKEFAPETRQALSALEIREMAPWVDFGSHTCFHSILTTCTDDEARRELGDSKTELERLLGRAVRHFSYPNGDYREREVRLARESGYASARTIDVGWSDVSSDPFRLRITGVTDDASIGLLTVQLSGVATYLRYLLAGSWRGRHRTTVVAS
jgi:peptidoglycan/xylan/chitin deacetylase (PgdA/CDA1 family)